MSSALETIYGTPAGKFLAKKMGLAEPPRLRRGRTLPTGPIVLGELDGGGIARESLELLGVTLGQPLLDVAANRTPDDKGRAQPPRYQQKPGALVIDATGVRTIAQLEEVRQLLRPVMRGLEPSGRVILLATDASAVEGLEAKAVARASTASTAPWPKNCAPAPPRTSCSSTTAPPPQISPRR